MRFLNLLAVLIFATTSSIAYGVTIGGIDLAATANSVLSSRGNFYDYNTSTDNPTIISSDQLSNSLTDTSAATFVVSPSTSVGFDSFVDLGFSDGIYNGAGNDLALFFVGDTGNPSVEINGMTRYYTPLLLPEPTAATYSYGSYNMTVAMINLDDFNLAYNADLASIRVHFNSINTSLSLAGSIYNTQQPSAVPLPLPALLFASGLGALGLFGRKRKQHN